MRLRVICVRKLFILAEINSKIMKRKITLLLFAAGSIFKMNSQIVLQEDFTSTFNPVTNGWSIQNLSASANPTLAWFQGNPSVFNAYNGAPADYVGANWAGTTDTNPATLSTWLLTPTINLINGATFQFATRTVTNPAAFPDRLEVYMSTAGNGTNCGTSPTTVGTFSTLLVSINPSLTTTGYPDSWTVYTVTITGVPVSTLGRVGFRYFVTNGGGATTATNSNYVGLDGVKYSLPCAQPTLSISQTSQGVCSGNTVSLVASTTGTVAATSYTWNTGQTASSIVVTPTASIIYTISASSSPGCVGTQTAAVTVTNSPIIQSNSYTVCSSPATTATLAATGATSYSWNTGATTSSIAVTPNTSTIYTVTGFGAGGNCPTTQTVAVVLGSGLSMAINASTTSVCAGRTVTLTAISAASSYSWNTGSTVQTITVAPTSTSIFSVGGLAGTFPNVCAGGNTIQINVLPNPTVSAVLNPTSVCQGVTYTLTGSGASSYFWFNTATTGFTNNPLSLVAGAAGPRSYTLAGFGANGCGVGIVVAFDVNPTPTVMALATKSVICVNNIVNISANGASTYAWSGASTSTASAFNYSTATSGVKTFTVVGTTTAACSATAAVTVTVNLCNGIEKADGNVTESTIFPNPFANELTLSGLEGTVEIYNALGQIVIKTVATDTETINTTELPKGAYILKAYNKEGESVKTIKLLKN